MKNLFLAFGLIVAYTTTSFAQFSIGLKGGITSPASNYQDISIGSGESATTLGVDDIKFGTQAGIYMRFGKRFFVQPEVLFNSNRTDFRIGQPGNNEIIKTSRYQNLDIPVLIGTKMGPFRFHAGPVAHYFLQNQSDLTDVNGFDEKWQQLTWGWIGGANVSLGRLSFDLRYEGNFNKFGDQITFMGDAYNFSQSPSRYVFALNYALVK
jgi:Outer membrane protein beta-barrel domain